MNYAGKEIHHVFRIDDKHTLVMRSQDEGETWWAEILAGSARIIDFRLSTGLEAAGFKLVPITKLDSIADNILTGIDTLGEKAEILPLVYAWIALTGRDHTAFARALDAKKHGEEDAEDERHS